jgi:hypothetical protein
MTLYKQAKFTLPVTSSKMSKEDFDYALGLIDANQYKEYKGVYPEEYIPENGNHDIDTWHNEGGNVAT